MNILYVNGHPNPESFHGAIEKTFTKAIKGTHDVEILNLGKETFDPVLRYGYAKRMKDDPFITKSQDLVMWADHIVFAFPIWWGDMPALLRGWIERVFTPGLTYRFEGFNIDPKLKGKTSDLIVTSRGIRPIHWLIGNWGVMTLLQNLFLLTGIRKKKIIRLGGVGFLPITNTAKRRSAFLARVQRHAARL